MAIISKLKAAARGKDDMKGEEKKGLMKTCGRLLFSHIGLFIIVILYAVGGAFILIHYELPEEEKRFQKKKVATELMIQAKKYIAKYAYFLDMSGETTEKFKEELRQKLLVYHFYIVDQVESVKYDGDPNSWTYDWTIDKSILFTITTMAAIGYGHISPKTKLMRIFTIYYGMIGIPLLLLFLANIGDPMANAFRYIYSRACCRWCRARRKVSELKKKVVSHMLWKEEVGLEPYMPTEYVDVPIMVNLLLIFVYLVMGGALFSYWENWEVHTAAYFTFITLTTIGFGDYVPGYSIVGDDAFDSAMKMLATIIFSLFGMALLSMAINLMKEQIVEKCRWLVKEMGISEDNENSKSKYKIMKSDPTTIPQTPKDKDGNQKKPFNAGCDFDGMKTPLLDSPRMDEEEPLNLVVVGC